MLILFCRLNLMPNFVPSLTKADRIWQIASIITIISFLIEQVSGVVACIS